MWTYQGNELNDAPEGAIGFVYLITNLSNNKKYIGKKLFSFSKTTYKTVKLKNGTKKKKKIKGKIESDWKTYFGSNNQLNEDIKNQGAGNFKREILHFCKSKAECSYIEAKLQFEYQVLESDDFYNGHIQVRVHKNHINGKLDKIILNS